MRNTLCNTSPYPYSIHFFFPFPFVLGETPLDATLLARDVWAVVDLLPFLTASSCLFYRRLLASGGDTTDEGGLP